MKQRIRYATDAAVKRRTHSALTHQTRAAPCV